MKKMLSLILIIFLFISCASVKNQNANNEKQNIGLISTSKTNENLNTTKYKNNLDVNVKVINKSNKEIQETKKKIENYDSKFEKKEINIRLIISKEGSKDIIFDKKIKTLPGKNALQILKENANVYEVGGFIKEINGIASIPQNELSNEDVQKGILGYDWFIYLNGQKTKIGAKDIILKDGDTLNFDYKGWTLKDLVP